MIVHLAVAGVADHEFAVEHGLPKSSREVVEHDDVLAGFAELPYHVGADVAGAPGYENCLFAHTVIGVT
jgi:hypothetical protein